MRIAALVVVVPLLIARGAGAEPPPFDGARAALEIPDEIWKNVLESGGRAGGAIGYTTDQMKDFGKDTHLLRTVQGMFRDVRKIPRESGRITDGLLENASKPSEVIARGYALTDVHAGRMYEPPKDLKWGLKELEEASTLTTALERVARQKSAALVEDPANLPFAVQRLLLDLYVAVATARPWVQHAAWPRHGGAWGVAPPNEKAHAQLVAPWKDEEGGQSATRQSVDFPDAQSRARMAYASVILAVHVERAVERYRAATPEERSGDDTAGISFPTDVGTFVVIGSKTRSLTGQETVVIDRSGDDTVEFAGVGLGWATSNMLSVHVDLAGNDTYRAELDGALAAGIGGIGMIVDVEGNDTYDAKSSSLGCGLYGTGLLWDLAGNDAYRSRGPWGQGCGHVGVGALIDLEGNDDYDCVEQAQGLGGTLGAGLLIDVRGNDTYVARDDGNVSALYLGQSVAMAQGCGYGRRADIGDGLSLAGGVGILLDGAGDDRYHAQVWAQGCAYWWALGILEDRGGDDNYRNGKYSAGAAAHFAVGVCVDLAGNDTHNATNVTAKNQFQGHARDGSIGVFVDGDGDDSYDVNNHCAGAADLNSIGLFWDRRGDDTYTFHDQALGEANGWNDTGACGAASRYKPFRSFRDDLPSWGLFLDTGGTDVYASDPAPTTFPTPGARDDTNWTATTGPLVFGLGWDLSHYATRPRMR